MANNCLITKLNGVVNNPDLQYLGEFRIKFRAIDNPQTGFNSLYLNSITPQKIKIVNGDAGSYFTIDGGSEHLTEYTVTASRVLFDAPNMNFDLIFEDKYNVSTISCQVVPQWNTIAKGWGFDIRDLEYSSLNSVYDTSNQFSEQNNVVFSFKGTDAQKQNFGGIWSNGTIIDVDSLKYNGTDLYTAFSYLSGYAKGNLINLSRYVKFIHTLILTSSPELHGDIDELATAMVAARRSTGESSYLTGDIRTCFIGSDVYDEGNLITREYMESKGGNYDIHIIFDPNDAAGYHKTYV